MDAAERLYGTHGMQGVSLRQISTAAGTRNNYAVQYHFGDSAGLIRAILARRTPQIELQRANLLARLSNAERVSTRHLLEANFRPVIALRTEDGPVFGRFMLALLSAPESWRPVDEAYAQMEIMQRIVELLAEANPEVPLRVIWQRLRLVAVMIFTAACTVPADPDLESINEAMVDDAFTIASAALSAPVGEQIDVLVSGAEKFFSR